MVVPMIANGYEIASVSVLVHKEMSGSSCGCSIEVMNETLIEFPYESPTHPAVVEHVKESPDRVRVDFKFRTVEIGDKFAFILN